jgi:hypothetical protein
MTLDVEEFKLSQRATWSAGDYAEIGPTIMAKSTLEAQGKWQPLR